MRFIAAAVCVLLAASACSQSAGDDPEPSSASPSASVPAELTPGVRWILVHPATMRGDVSITFDEEQLSGQAPVNRYFGPFTATDDGHIDIGPVASTMMAGDPALMKSERKYLELLERVDTFDSNGMELTLRAGRETVLRYAQPDSPALFGSTLVGRTVPQARARAKAAGYEFRVISVDGEGRPATTDYNPLRLNATVVDGRVTEVTTG